MKKTVLSLCLLLVAGCSSQSNLLGREWHQITTDHFEIITDADPQVTAELASDLERFRVAIAALSKSELRDFDKLTIFAASDYRTYQKLLGKYAARNTYGVFFSSFYGNYALVDLMGYRDTTQGKTYWARQFLFHEYTHYVMSVGSAIQYPYWYREGYAELFSTLRFDRDAVVFGEVPIMRGISLNRHDAMPIEKLITAEEGRLSPKEIDQLYATGWLLTHMLSTNSAYVQQLEIFLKQQAKTDRPVDAFVKAFGVNTATLDAQLQEYMGRGIHAYSIGLDLDNTAPEVNITAIEPDLAMARLGRLYAMSKDRAKALSDLRQLVKNPQYKLDLEYSQVSAYLVEGQLEKATALMQSLATGSDTFWPRLVRAEWLRSQVEDNPENRQQLLTEAYGIYRELLSQDDRNAALWFGLGQSASQLMVPPHTYKKYFSEAYYLNPRFGMITAAYIQSLLESEDWQELARILPAVLDRTPDPRLRRQLQQLIQMAEMQLTVDG